LPIKQIRNGTRSARRPSRTAPQTRTAFSHSAASRRQRTTVRHRRDDPPAVWTKGSTEATCRKRSPMAEKAKNAS